MSRIALSDSGSWKLSFSEQDVRGYRAVDKDGTPVGVVDAMIVNTDEKRVDAVVLDDGTEYPARDLSIGDGVVYLTTVEANGASRVDEDYGRVVARDTLPDADYGAHADAFRTHHASTYDGTDFADYDPAYRYGYEAAYADGRRDRPFVDVEPDLKAGYADRDFDRDRAAIRYGYTRAQHGTR